MKKIRINIMKKSEVRQMIKEEILEVKKEQKRANLSTIIASTKGASTVEGVKMSAQEKTQLMNLYKLMSPDGKAKFDKQTVAKAKQFLKNVISGQMK